MKCKFCSYSTSNKRVMVGHLKLYHSSKIQESHISRSSGSMYSSVSSASDDSILDNLALFAVAETLLERQDDTFVEGGGGFDGGGASDTYEATSYTPSSSSSDYSSSSSSSDCSSSSSSDSCSSSCSD